MRPRPESVYRNVRDRTASYEIVRHRTSSYELVRVRTRTYGNVQNAFRGKLVPVMHLELSRGVLGSSAANFGVVFVILVTWATSYQRSACRVLQLRCTRKLSAPSSIHHLRLSNKHRTSPGAYRALYPSRGVPRFRAQNGDLARVPLRQVLSRPLVRIFDFSR